MAVTLSSLAGAATQFFDNNGVPLAGGLIYTYTAGTTTPAATYTSNTGLTAHSNPIVLDAAGRIATGEIWLTTGVDYKFLVKTSANVQIGSYDNIPSINDFTAINAEFADLSNTSNIVLGDAMIGFRQSDSSGNLASAVGRTVHQKFQETVSVKDFGAIGDGVTNDTAAIQAAITSNRNVIFPVGTYLIGSALTFLSLSNFALQGQSNETVTIKCSAVAFSSYAFDFQSCTNFEISNITFDQNDNASFTSNFAVVRYVNSSQCNFNFNKIINHTFIGLAIDSCSNFVVSQNYIEKTTQTNTTNYNINVSSSASVSLHGQLINNYVKNSGIGVIGTDITITGNICNGTKYGAGIATFSAGAAGSQPGQVYGRYSIQGNYCFYANGRDADGFMCCGMEIAGVNSLIQNNTVYSNHGEGIRLFAYQSICSGNIVFNNGLGLDGTYKQSGIAAYFSSVNATYSASYSLIQGNRCFDTGGGTQLYGYAEQSTALTAMQITSNNFNDNTTAPVLLAVTSGNSYDLDYWFSYTPVITSTVGTITTSVCTGKYMRKGQSVFYEASCQITNNGTGSGALNITLPINSSNVAVFTNIGNARAISGKSLIGTIIQLTNVVTVTDYNNIYPASTGETIVISGWYAA
jgi:hypothetical protein